MARTRLQVHIYTNQPRDAANFVFPTVSSPPTFLGHLLADWGHYVPDVDIREVTHIALGDPDQGGEHTYLYHVETKVPPTTYAHITRPDGKGEHVLRPVEVVV